MSKRDIYISVPRAARMCGLSPGVFRRLIDDGAIPAIRPISHLRIKVSDVERFIRERTEAPVAVDRLTAEESRALA